MNPILGLGFQKSGAPDPWEDTPFTRWVKKWWPFVAIIATVLISLTIRSMT